MYAPLKRFGALKGGLKIGIIGIGGLGQFGIRLAKAMGNDVTAISTSASKKETALSIGASRFIVSKDPEQMKEASKSLDLIINTVSANHQVMSYWDLLVPRGSMVVCGVVAQPQEVRSS